MEESRKRGREWAGYLLAVLALAAAYAVIGRLGLLLAIPPGYATAAWPPSGIALAALLLWGSRLWPGVLLGSMLVNLLTSGDFGTAEAALSSGLGATSIGLGAALQAMAGAYLIRRLVGYSNFLTQEVDVVRVLALGGPVACVINATVGVTTLWLAGLIPASNYWFNWWTWWIGDSIGVLIFTPLVCIWTLRPARAWLRRQLAVTVPLAAMFAAVVVVFFITSAREYERVEA
ncbi:MAG TPA: MASE1 domain-containing protein, partial [Roseateles sp.]|nr:MASE1 domain-containing protein [Roseateles sp.]